MPAQPAHVPPMSPELMTAEQLLDVSIPGKQVELVRGRLVVKEPPGYRHGDIEHLMLVIPMNPDNGLAFVPLK